MTKLFSYILITLIATGICFSQTVKEKEKQMVTRNNIKAKLQTDYKYIDDTTPEKTGKLSSKTIFDGNGNILEKHYYGPKKEIISWEKYEYDENGNRTLFERSSSTGQYKKASIYDDEDKILLESGYDGAEPFKTTYKYSPSGKPLEIVYSFSNQVDEKRIYEYNGRKAVVKVLGGGKNLISMIDLNYDEKDNLIKETVKDRDGNVIETKNYTYTSSSKILTEEKEKAGKLSYRITYAYDAKNNLISVTEESPSKGKFVKKEFSYNDNGGLTEYKWRRKPADEFNVKTYISDEKGVWVSEHSFYPSTKYQSLSKYEYESF